MTYMTLALLLLSVESGSFRVGLTFDAAFPAMEDEKDYVDVLEEGGLDVDLDRIAWSGGIEALGDVSEKVRLRGSVSLRRFTGAYEEDYDPLSYIILGMFTFGIGFLFGQEHDVVSIEDQSLDIAASIYYKLNSGPAVFSVGGGPLLAFVSRGVETPETSVTESGTSAGFEVAVRVDQEPGGKVLGCLPVVFGLEAGYRRCSSGLDGEGAGDFPVDFSGPYARVGTYLPF